MRWSAYYLFTTREMPSDAEVISHQLMVRAGMIKKVAAGIYSYLPFGWRSVAKLMAIVHRELDATGALELELPAIQPAELWQESGRWGRYGKELLRIKDRHERDFVFGPTHEEVVTDLVRRDVKSYRQLPFNLYQIQTKFRDEIRPRFGLMRGREFLMKDAYSFHASAASLETTYRAMGDAYCRIFESCHLDYTMVEADTGAIGGSASHEFMVVAETGESAVVRCPACAYAANVEKAETRLAGAAPSATTTAAATAEPAAAAATTTPLAAAPAGPHPPQPLAEVATPGLHTVEEVARFLKVSPRRVVKTLIYETEQGLVAAAIRGDREINEVKLANHLGVQHAALAGEEKVRQSTAAPVGFAGPVGLSLRLIADQTVRGLTNFVAGANRADAHLTGVNWGRDAEPYAWADLLLVTGGDLCPRCDGRLELFRGIEVGHIFKLGTKYSAAMACNYTDESGADHPMVMGCYGLGIGRTVAAAIEQNHDADGIIWPRPLAPFEILLAALNPDDPQVARVAEELYAQLRQQGAEVLYDDRDERPGVKFKDADLIGIPVRVVVGSRSLASGQVELSLRRDREKHLVPPAEAAARALALLDR
ncbi:MAG TPA: proline--tRNA ligase [Thermoanaerobaculia bacterium]|nr:proline--tRNA ligase [Thermoanaerobaculia bacterium]